MSGVSSCKKNLVHRVLLGVRYFQLILTYSREVKNTFVYFILGEKITIVASLGMVLLIPFLELLMPCQCKQRSYAKYDWTRCAPVLRIVPVSTLAKSYFGI